MRREESVLNAALALALAQAIALASHGSAEAAQPPAPPKAQGQGQPQAQPQKKNTRFESGFLITGPKPTPQGAPSPVPPPPRKSSVGMALEDGGAVKSEKAVGAKDVSPEVITSLTQLLKATAPGTGRNTLFLNRAAAINLYVRQALLKSKSHRIDENGGKYLKAAVSDSTQVLASPVATNEQKQRARSLLGFSHIYLDQPREARGHFLELLNLNPNVENAGWIGLFIAEDYFEEGRFNEAALYYRNYYRRMSAQSREIATYKLAWCMINLNQPDKAENIFVRLIQNNPKTGLGRDSIRDLAFLLAHHKDPAPAIRKTEGIFKDVADRLDFMGYVRTSLENQNLVALHTELVDRMLTLETDKEKQIQLLLANLRVNRRLYASREHLAAFRKLLSNFKANGIAPGSAACRKLEPEIETELQPLIKAWIDTFSGRTLTPEGIEKHEQAAALKSQFAFFNSYLPESKQRPLIVNLWLDVCVDSQDWDCVDSVADLVMGDETRFASLLERAWVDQLAALEELVKVPAAKGGEGALEGRKSKRLSRMKAFVERKEANPQWLRIARQYAQILSEPKAAERKHDELIPILERIYLREPTADGFYRLQWARFEAGRFAEVLADQRDAKRGQPEPRLVELWRESSLALAAAARKEGDFIAYRTHVHRFLSLNPTEKKAMVARQDYFAFMLEKKLLAELTGELLQLAPALRHDPALDYPLTQAWALNLEKGGFKESAALLAGNPRPKPEALFRDLLTSMAQGRAPTIDQLLALRAQDREYTLGILALVKPALALAYFGKKPAKSEAERGLLELAYRMDSGEWVIRRSPRSENFLGRGYKDYAVEEPKAALALETRYAGLKFPKPSMKPAKLAQVLQELVGETQKLRGLVSKAIAGKTPGVQLRVAEKARDHEKKVAQAILNSPVPKELESSQLEEYSKGLEAAAKEFQDQSAEFDRLATTIRESIQKGKDAFNARVLPQPSPEHWGWPASYSKDPSLKVVGDLTRTGNFLGALALLDFLKTGGSAKPVSDEEDYHRVRSGVLLSSKHFDTLRIYLLGELESHKQNRIIEEWRKLAKESAL